MLALLTVAAAARAETRAVSLRDARTAPTMLEYLPAGHARTFTHQCPRGGSWSDVSAYQWTGKALGPQTWHGRRVDPFYSWRRPHTRDHVRFDGVTFTNDTLHPVIVAGWCE
jgi:hypothetical protein